MKRTSVALASLVAMLSIACAEPPVGPNLLADLSKVTAADSTGEPPPAETTAPGFFRGVVLGYEPGPDTLASAVRLENVVVEAFLRVGDQPVGDAAGTAVSNAEGEWQLPVMPGAEYVVIFRPPSGSAYRGAWTIGRTTASSGEHRWWIMLAAQ